MQLQLLQQHAGKQPKEVPTIHILLSNRRSQRTLSWRLNCHSSLKWLHNWADSIGSQPSDRELLSCFLSEFSGFHLPAATYFITPPQVYLMWALGRGIVAETLGLLLQTGTAEVQDLPGRGEVHSGKLYLVAHLVPHPPPSSESLSRWWWPLPLEEESLTPKVRARFETPRSLLNLFLQVGRVVTAKGRLGLFVFSREELAYRNGFYVHGPL